jgi:hypothetical protein
VAGKQKGAVLQLPALAERETASLNWTKRTPPPAVA